MKTKVLLTALASFAGFIAVPAQAETFDGPYVGVLAGYNRAEVADRTIEAQPIDAEVSREALVLGGYAGYNYKVNDRLVIGAEAGFSGAFDDELRAQSAGGSVTIDPRYSFDLSARAGYLVNDKTLVYVRGGYANSRVRTTLVSDDGTTRASDNLDGWLVGGGVERALTDRISARLEYRYTDLGNNGGQYDQHQALVGISYNF
ncbi:outer membrane immunogenic protein [Altererythrobacter xiamenensis]|uniref:Outer membrane immunogenic protein n=1 Tax=Altererythrobacter xiamenensis TaxID=1316679 RepID=A0A1Y6EMS5_9SPHN|nr:outer membrane beta-barrel protein [Altererythrobacter xiamenensis]SMQ63609.1 outer membrane immunogenic protein [Altererythrobacter xiamenensis]